MKHIDTYENSKNRIDLNNLSDCLQEIFDKYKIKESELSVPCWFKSTHHINNWTPNFHISIHTTTEIHEALINDILKSKKNIELRISYKICIIDNNDYIIIVNKKYSHNYYTMGKLYENNNINNNINNLEDCLQEVFDKFNITKLNRHQGEYYPDANDSKKTQLYYCIGRYSDEYGDVDNYGILIGYGKDELTEVKKSIISKRKLIESRLESEVYIGTPPNTDYLLIRLI